MHPGHCILEVNGFRGTAEELKVQSSYSGTCNMKTRRLHSGSRVIGIIRFFTLGLGRQRAAWKVNFRYVCDGMRTRPRNGLGTG